MDLQCLLLGLNVEGRHRAVGGPGRRVRLMLEQRQISAQAPRKLIDPIKTTVSAEAEVAEAHFVLAEVSLPDPVVFFYLGLAKRLDKPVISIRRFDAPAAVPVHRLAEFPIDYEDSGPGREELAKKLNGALDALELQVRRDHGVLLGQSETELDWSKLTAIDHGNLCFELLLREGFREIAWLDGTQEVDLTALRAGESSHHELYLISIGSGLADDFAVQGWSSDLETLGHRVRRIATRHGLLAAQQKLELNVLFLWSPLACRGDHVRVEEPHPRELGRRLASVAAALGATLGLRLSAWHRHRFEAKIRGWPMLVRHYFARDGGSETIERRKNAEDLYRDAARLGQRAAEASGQLEQKYGLDPGFEWQRRAYTVTHSIGNAIFPVETYLDFLYERLAEAGDTEGEELARRSLESIEKAKLHIFKFKNIARFKKPRLQPIDILPRLDVSLAAAEHRGIRVDRYIGPHPPVTADPDLFDELLDELVANSISWLEKSETRRLEITVKPAAPDDLSPRLQGSPDDFLWLRYADSGPGVRHELKEKIFELFFSTNPQGMGFGLAIVRKNLRDFGGDIIETGMPGRGICFEIFLPLAGDGRPA